MTEQRALVEAAGDVTQCTQWCRTAVQVGVVVGLCVRAWWTSNCVHSGVCWHPAVAVELHRAGNWPGQMDSIFSMWCFLTLYDVVFSGAVRGLSAVLCELAVVWVAYLKEGVDLVM